MKHRKTIKHYHEPGHLHELTFSCHGRQSLLSNNVWCSWLARSIDTAGEENEMALVAFVFMPEHVHLLVHSEIPKPPISRYLAFVKQPLSKRVKESLTEIDAPLLKRLTIEARPGKWWFQFWQAGPGFDRNLFSAKAIESSINYIHMNPVARGLCQKPTDWKWSSARHYSDSDTLDIDPQLPRVFGLPSGALS